MRNGTTPKKNTPAAAKTQRLKAITLKGWRLENGGVFIPLESFAMLGGIAQNALSQLGTTASGGSPSKRSGRRPAARAATATA